MSREKPVERTRDLLPFKLLPNAVVPDRCSPFPLKGVEPGRMYELSRIVEPDREYLSRCIEGGGKRSTPDKGTWIWLLCVTLSQT